MKIQKKQEIEFFGTKTGNANSIALGYATETKNFGEVAVGVMNKSTAAKDPNSSKGVCVDPDATLFSVGCGGSGERKNALEVKGDGSVIIPGENGDINIADKIKQAFDTDASIELVKSSENSLQYTLMVNNESRGSINIPKDQFLKNVTYDSDGKQLVFTFVTLDEDEHVERVPVGDLKDIYTAGEGITINGDNVISADFSSVMTAISDEKTQRETTDNEIKSTLDTKADKEIIVCRDDKKNIIGNFDSHDVPLITDSYSNIIIGYNNAIMTNSDNRILIGNNNESNTNCICIGSNNLSPATDSICIGDDIFNTCKNSICIGHNLHTHNEVEHNIIIGNFDSNNNNVETNNHFISIGYNALSNTRKAEYSVIYQIAGYDYKNKEKSYNLEETLDIGSNHKKYIYGIGGYNGNNLVVMDEYDYPSFNPNVKSVQEVINEKADASAIPTKVSQLINDSKFTISNDFVTFAGLVVDNNAKIKYIQKTGGLEGTYLTAEITDDRVANKVFAADGSLFDVSKLVKKVQCNVSGDANNIEFGYTTVDGTYNFSVIPTVTTKRSGIMSSADKVKLDSLPSITAQLDNITAASTAEEVVTKFNTLLADLKAKGYMKADE